MGTAPLKFAGRVILTAVLGFSFLYILAFVATVHFNFLKSEALRRNPPPLFVGIPSRPRAQGSGTSAFWPQFPGSGQAGVRSTILNGVQILTQDWDCAASAGEILAYYREQMTARGWSDVTEETYGLQPESRTWGTGSRGLQDPRYLEAYHKVMDRNLALNRGDWSMHITTEPKRRGMGGTAVSIYAAATPSIHQFFHDLGASMTGLGNRGGEGKPLDAVQLSGGQRYHTMLSMKAAQPTQAFQEALANCRADGWQPVMMVPAKGKIGGPAAWLTKGAQYAMLSVKPTPDGQRSSVTLMEVTPQ
jgi:hypothetical protein